MGVLTLMFHDVATDEFASVRREEAESGIYVHEEHMFAKYLDAIEETGLCVTTVDTLSGDINEKQILLTVDDGGVSNLFMADTFEKKGWRGHFFIISRGMEMKGYIPAATVRELSERGHIIGTHTHTHPLPFSKLAYSEMVNEWRDSANRLADVIGKDVIDGSVPGGSYNKQIALAAAEAGLKRLFTSDPICNPWTSHGIQCFGRICPKRNTPPNKVKDYAEGKFWDRELRLVRLKRFVKHCLFLEK